MHASTPAPRIALYSLAICTFLSHSASAASIVVDGKISEGEWAGAQHITDFKLVQPLTGADAPQPTEAWILSTPEGLAIGFRNTQPASVPRTRERTRRDGDAAVDRVNLMVDYDGNGGIGYNFTLNLTNGIQDAVISNENRFSNDWDGLWQHAVSEEGDTWSAEMLIPWYIAPMQKANGDKRTIGIYLDRVIGTTGERMAWPAASYTRPRFLSDFAKIDIPQYSQSLFAITPYVVGVADIKNSDSMFDTGADIYWKPNSNFQLTATLNPDFGQVESDQLVVNFDAVETFFSDKRPFFTENQSLFNIGFGSGGSLIYTRRVGGQADDQSGAGDVTAAIKLNGSFGDLNYGVFAATEADAVGRDFYALRLTQDFGKQDFGFMATQVNSPFFNRVANVYSVDHHWKPNDNWNIVTQFAASDIYQNGVNTKDTGMQISANQELKNGWRHNAYFVHLGADLELNDFGYLDRNSFNFLRYELQHRITDLPESSRYRSKDWTYAIARRVNDSGELIYDAARINRYSETRSGGNEFFQFVVTSEGINDLITRGNGNVKTPARFQAFYESSSARKGNWEFYRNARIGQSGLENIDHSDIEFTFNPKYYVNDSLSINLGLNAEYKPDWLLWQRNGNLLGTFEATRLGLNVGMQWLIGTKQELRVKLETIALNATAKQAWRPDAQGNPVATNDVIRDFNLNNLGFQIRYRYELAPLSDLFVVYSRGGFGSELDNPREPFDLLGDAFSLRDSEMFLVKLSYRFNI